MVGIKRARIQEWVRNDLAQNNYAPGARLPYGVYELTHECDASTATVVHAVRELHELGEVEVRPHIGYFAVERAAATRGVEGRLTAARAALAAAQEQLAIASRLLTDLSTAV